MIEFLMSSLFDFLTSSFGSFFALNALSSSNLFDGSVTALGFFFVGSLLLVFRYFWIRILLAVLKRFLPNEKSVFRRLYRGILKHKNPDQPVETKKQEKKRKDFDAQVRKCLNMFARWAINWATIYSFGAAIVVFVLPGFIDWYNKLILSAALIALVPWMRSFVTIVINFYLSRFELVEQTIAVTISRVSSIMIIICVVVILLEYWGIAVTPIITGLGIFGVALALGAQDLFRNLIAGATILAEKRFALREVIELNAEIFGTVERIGLRTTEIRRFDDHLIFIPNSTLADNSLVNISKRGSFRLNWMIGLEYGTSPETLTRICSRIRTVLDNHPDVLQNMPMDATEPVAEDTDHHHKGRVRIAGFAASSIDILVYCFFATTVWGRWLALREEIALQILEIVNDEQAAFAFPSQTVYVRNDNPPAPNGKPVEIKTERQTGSP